MDSCLLLRPSDSPLRARPVLNSAEGLARKAIYFIGVPVGANRGKFWRCFGRHERKCLNRQCDGDRNSSIFDGGGLKYNEKNGSFLHIVSQAFVRTCIDQKSSIWMIWKKGNCLNHLKNAQNERYVYLCATLEISRTTTLGSFFFDCISSVKNHHVLCTFISTAHVLWPYSWESLQPKKKNLGSSVLLKGAWEEIYVTMSPNGHVVDCPMV